MSKLRPEMLKFFPKGHFGIKITKAKTRKTIYWPGMASQIEDDDIKECRTTPTETRIQRHDASNTIKLKTTMWQKL